ncbi:MAG TPA: hypothetical protein VF528_09140 [Pyrinomonadaceae bacterium]|jgi:hypothetical protein
MENVTLRAHFDGRQIVLDEPFELEPGAKLIITVLPESAGEEREDGSQLPSEGSVPDGGGDVPENPFKKGYEFSETNPPAEERVVFKRVAIRDPDVNNIEGATLLLPEGWNLEGGFVWMPLFSVQANLLVRASDPQTGAAVETLPLQFYVWPMQMVVPMQIGTNYLGSVLMPPPRTPVEFVQNIYMQGPLQHLRGARLEDVEDMPQLAAEVARSHGAGRTVYVSRLRYSYQFGGRAWEEEVYPTLVFEPADGMIAMWYGMGNSMRAPAGELERLRPLLSVIVPSIRFTLDWSACLEQVRQMYRQNRANQMQRTRDLGRMLTQYREEMRRAHQQVYEERMASQDRISFARREIIGGIETYVNPFDSHAVELPSGYSYHWVSDDGTIISTNSATLDPRPGDRRNWQNMKRYRP